MSDVVVDDDSELENPLQRYLPLLCGGLVFYFCWFCVINGERLGNLLNNGLRPDLVIGHWAEFGAAPLGCFDRWPIWLGVTWIVAMAWVWGTAALKSMQLDKGLTLLESLVLAVVAGLSLLSSVTFFIGVAGSLRVLPWWILLSVPSVAMGAYLLRNCRAMAQELVESCKFAWQDLLSPVKGDIEAREADAPARWPELPIGIALFTAFLLVGAMLPPLDFDVRAYHLQVPKEWLQSGRIGLLEHNIYGNMPLAAEMHAVLGGLLSPAEPAWWWGGLIGKTVMALHLPLAACLLFAAGVRFFQSRAIGLLAAAFYVSTPWLVQIGQRGLNENVLACLLVAAIYPLAIAAEQLFGDTSAHAEEKGEKQPAASEQSAHVDAGVESRVESADCPRARDFVRLAALSGFFVGASVAVKYTAAVFVLLPVGALWIWLSWAYWHRQTGGSASKTKSVAAAVTLFALAATVPAGPWLAKNVWLTGNPVYPLAANVFGDPLHSAEQQSRWRQAHAVPEYSAKQFTKAFSALIGQSRGYQPLLVPLALIGFVAGWIPAFEKSLRWRLLWLSGGLAAWVIPWFCLTHRLERFLTPAVPLLALLAAAGCICPLLPPTTLPNTGTADANKANGGPWRITLRCLFVAGFLVALLEITTPAGSMRDTRFFASLEYLQDDSPPPEVERASRVSRAHGWLNRNLQPGERVLLVGDAQPFDLLQSITHAAADVEGNGPPESPVLYNSCFDHCVLEQLCGDKPPADKLAALQAANIRYVLVHWAELARYRSEGNYGYAEYPTARRLDRDFVTPGILQPLPAGEIGLPTDVVTVYRVAD